MVFKSPSAYVPEGTGWLDIDGMRHFSSAFYADLLSDLGASLVIGIGPSECDPRPFRNRGIEVESLAFDDDDFSGAAALTLQALDRFMTLVGGAGGLVALHCSGRVSYACTLLSAYMLRRRFFADPVQAVSWLAIACPGTCLRLRPALVETIAAGAAGPGSRLMRSISHGDELSSLNAAKDERGSKRQPEGGCGPSGPAALLTRTGAAGESELSRRVAQSRRAMMLSSSSPHL